MTTQFVGLRLYNESRKKGILIDEFKTALAVFSGLFSPLKNLHARKINKTNMFSGVFFNWTQ